MKKTISKIAIAAALAAGALTAGATPIVGVANLTLGGVIVSFGNVDWNGPVNPPPNAVRTYGDFQTGTSTFNTGSFAGVAFTGLTTGRVQDLSSNPADANYVPIGSSLPGGIPKFLQFVAQPGWLFTERFLSAGTLAGTPYILTELNGNVSATISTLGVACDTLGDGICDLTDSKTNWTGVFSAQYTNTSIAAMTTLIGGGGILPNVTWSGRIEATAIPEPGSIALLGLGLIGLAAVRRRSVK
jgi:PEP-CTERM motif